MKMTALASMAMSISAAQDITKSGIAFAGRTFAQAMETILRPPNKMPLRNPLRPHQIDLPRMTYTRAQRRNAARRMKVLPGWREKHNRVQDKRTGQHYVVWPRGEV